MQVKKIMRILIVEDETDLLYALKKGLKQEGYAIDLAENGKDALELLEETQYDCVVLDINLPELNGFEVLDRLRKENKEIKVLILSANSEIDDRVAGLDKGANDYLVKPFHLKELKARLRALLRRQFISLDQSLVFGDLKMNLPSRTLTWKDEKIPLTVKEFALLEYFMIKKDCYISSEELIEHIWNEEADLFSNAVRVHIYSLRKKLWKATGYDTIIETIPMAGYRFYSGFYEVKNEK